MIKFKNYIFYTIITLCFLSCFDDSDDVVNPASNTDIGDFIWKGMNLYYLYQDDVSDLADDRFSTQNELNSYISTFSSPETFFESLIYDRTNVDKYSWIVSDYEALENAFAGTSKLNGMSFGFFADPDASINKAYGYVRYVIPGSDADSKGIIRGNVFNTVNDVEITYDLATGQIDSGIISFLSQDTYNIGMATYDGSTVSPSSTSISLTKGTQTENPVFKTEVLEVNGTKIGYLMYNAFTSNFDDQMNAAFSTLQSQGVSELVLDLRYNSGGSVLSAITLSSSITGQFTGQVFSTEQWNTKVQEFLQENNPDRLVNNFIDTNRNGQAINSLNLNRVYILTTGRSASASELVINCLDPYIDVIQIGTTTTGKYQASITLYDSENFTNTNVNPSHKYAIQPLVFKSVNSVGVSDYDNGLSPETDFVLAEDYSNMGVLGNENEPLLALAINHITGGMGIAPDNVNKMSVNSVRTLDFNSGPLDNKMYSEKDIPDGVFKLLY